jgi:hypothetical protein
MLIWIDFDVLFTLIKNIYKKKRFYKKNEKLYILVILF